MISMRTLRGCSRRRSWCSPRSPRLSRATSRCRPGCSAGALEASLRMPSCPSISKETEMSTTTLPRPTRPRPADGFGSGRRIHSLVRGRAEDPAWARIAFIGLLVATAIAYLWNLTASGDANSFYAAAVQAGTKSWKAMFFGSLDSSNFITVDKPPASLWVMGLPGRLSGFSSGSILVPQAFGGVAAVGLLYAAVKRWFGAGAGLAAGALFAATPVAALMFRFDNPDALLVLLLVASAYCLTRSLERAGTRWIAAAGA